MNEILCLSDDVLIHYLIIYLNTYDLINLKKISKYYYNLIERNKYYIYHLILVNNSKITFKIYNHNYSFYYINHEKKHNYGFSICRDIPLEQCLNKFNIMLKFHNLDAIV